MNDELELIEEFQSDSIDELASERKKNKVIQRFTMQPSSSTKYYYIENYPNGDSIKSEISPENLDELGKNNRGSLAKEKHSSDSLFYATIPIVLHYEGGYVNDKVDRELCFNLIRRNDDKEIEKQFEFFTNGDNQTNVVLHFYENESNEEWKEIDPAEEIEGKTGSIEWGYPVPKGTPVKIIVKRDNSGCVRIYAECCGAKGEFEIVTSIDSNHIKK